MLKFRFSRSDAATQLRSDIRFFDGVQSDLDFIYIKYIEHSTSRPSQKVKIVKSLRHCVAASLCVVLNRQSLNQCVKLLLAHAVREQIVGKCLGIVNAW